MFKSKRFGNVIISDEGFEVHINSEGIGSLMYLEGDKKMTLNAELLSIDNGSGIAIWKSSIKKWKEPHDGENVDEKKCGEILSRVVSALEFAKYNKIDIL